MRCRFCGDELVDGERYCPSCGQRTGGVERVMPEQIATRFSWRAASSGAVAVLDARPAAASAIGKELPSSWIPPTRNAPSHDKARYFGPIRRLCLDLIVVALLGAAIWLLLL